MQYSGSIVPADISPLSDQVIVVPASSLAPVLSVLNMKGGVGKTTISAHVMRVFYHRKRLKTLLIDLDPQFNLSQALIPRSSYDQMREQNRTVLTAFEPPSESSLFEVAVTSSAPPKALDLSAQLRYFPNSEISLDLLPGDFKLIKYSLVENHDMLGSARDRFKRFVGESRKDYDLIVIDCNPSSSFITTCALSVCTDLLVPVKPDRYSMLGLELLMDLLDELSAQITRPRVHVLLNHIPRSNYDRTVEDEIRAHSEYGTMTMAHRVPRSTLLEARANYTGFATDKPVPWKELLKGELTLVVDELSTILGFG